MGSDQTNCLVIFVCSLLVFDYFLANSPAAGVNPEHHANQGPREPPVNQTLSTPLECARQCHDGEPPKMCYYQFMLEMYPVLGAACDLCTPSNTNDLNSTCQCVTADGIERTILVANRMLPGPSIQVCKGDTVVVDVTNRLFGMAVTLHWHGIFQRHSPYYDGVPMVTQCPILTGNTFRYEFLAGNAGTHFWHVHTALHKMDGLHGSLIVREPPSKDPNSKLYDHDSLTHVMSIADWMHVQSIDKFPGNLVNNTGQFADSMLINGKGRYTNPITNVSTTTPYEVFTVKPGYRHRFRMINAFCTTCPAQLVVEGHNLTVISADGIPVKPTIVSVINSFPGKFCSLNRERFDFIINANKPRRSYWIQVRALGECAANRVQQHAILRYEGHEQPTSVPPAYTQILPEGRLLGPSDGICNRTRKNATCISQLKSAVPVDEELLREKPCVKFYFALDFHSYRANSLYKPNTYQLFMQQDVRQGIISTVNNVTFVLPPSPPLSQYEDIADNRWCYANNLTTDCGEVCGCTQRIDIPLNCTVEAIFTDGVGSGNLSHPIHLHGYAFNVIGMGKSPVQNVSKMSIELAQELDAKNQLCRNEDRPPFKDTVAIPTGGYVIVRFRANNPGWWLLHCHFVYHILIGMNMLVHVGEPKDLPPIPPHFPKCGNSLPPIGYSKHHKKSQYN